ncbi:MAG: exo-alpha-sialidase [Clostridia bacterium]|nr:exo-alpha-sialidase [Clostridia bacterium]
MKFQLIGAPKVVMDNPMSLHNYFAWPTVARLKNGKIALAASGFRLAHICPFGKAAIAFSEDEGDTYTRPMAVIDTPLDDRDTGLCPFGKSGLIVTSFNNTVAQQRGWSKGEEYRLRYLDRVSPEEEAKYLGSTFRVSFDNGVTFGPLYKSPVTSPHGPTEMPDGSIVYVGRTFDARAEKDCISAYTLDPETGAMEHLGDIENITDEKGTLLSCEPHAIALPDGTLICHIRVQRSLGNFRYDAFANYQSVSRDGGRTWTPPERILDPLAGAPPHILRHSSGKLISVVARREAPFGIRALVSCDDGKTWEGYYEVYHDPISPDSGYPATVELKDGSLQTVFYAHPEQNGPAVIVAQNWKLED